MSNRVGFPLEEEPMDFEYSVPLLDLQVQPAAIEWAQIEPMEIECVEPMDIDVSHPVSNEKPSGTLIDATPCTICLETDSSSSRKSLSCSHSFHQKCIEKWLRRSATCPICRSTISSRNNAARPDADWRQTTWITETYVEFNQIRVHHERDTSRTNRLAEHAQPTYTQTTTNRNGFIRQRRILVARRWL